MAFKVGDTVVHPGYGAGEIVEIKTLEYLGHERKTYYSIALLSDPGTTIMVPIRDEDKVGLRPPISPSRMGRVWRVLGSAPQKLPSNYKERYALVEDKLQGGNTLRIAEALRDMAWRREQKRSLTVEGKRLYDRAIRFLSAEIAGSRRSDPSTVEAEISQVLYSQ
jgi:RNA polymerase-interacting CarD/CdnL/TRCF family regulator